MAYMAAEFFNDKILRYTSIKNFLVMSNLSDDAVGVKLLTVTPNMRIKINKNLSFLIL